MERPCLRLMDGEFRRLLRFVRVGPVNLCIMNKLWGTRLDSNEGPLPCQGARGAPALSHGRPESRCWSKRSAAMASTCTHCARNKSNLSHGLASAGGCVWVAAPKVIRRAYPQAPLNTHRQLANL